MGDNRKTERPGLNSFLYATKDNLSPVMVRARIKPSVRNIPKCGTWIISEYGAGRWCATGEVTWGRLSQLHYIGKVKMIDRSVLWG